MRLLADRIDILPFFFLKSRESFTQRKIVVKFCLKDIAVRLQKHQSAAVTHTGEILARCSGMIVTSKSHIPIETAL